ncbi:Dabb family protein [Bosea sp. (in: a-proteobacteria)]|uniref:Dabb family protein n=1 Tax=Bosea sp. (in: a-proteobacteria) TaxID=1871050 RepID=UPI002607129B|nr:Dabb family protein [Bosea sp. (in: a-proteobacteria)]MCO5090934.1 Dabb family protein [Bosea sp. (in: a-proteobacteria)]
MIRHSVLFSFKPTADKAACDALLREYVTFPQVHKNMRNFTLGKNISERDQTFQYAFSVDFDNEQDLKDYLNSREHEEHVVERFRPLISGRAIVSYEVADGAVTNLFD